MGFNVFSNFFTNSSKMNIESFTIFLWIIYHFTVGDYLIGKIFFIFLKIGQLTKNFSQTA